MAVTLQEQAKALGDPTRHRIFRYVADADRPIDVAELTAHFALITTRSASTWPSSSALTSSPSPGRRAPAAAVPGSSTVCT